MPTLIEILWLFAVPAAVFSWYHIARNLKGFIPPVGKLPPAPHAEIIFSIAARSLTAALKQPVDAIRNSCAEVGFSNFKIMLVVDKVETALEGVTVLVVPKDFVCKSQYKARALHYQLQHLPNSKESWTLHLDEDALVTPQCVVRLASYIQNNGKPIANGPSVFPYDGNLLTFYAESQRQWTFYWLKDQETTSVVHWLNGSNLLIRSDIEHAVGWDFINCFISEDARFGYEATKKFHHAKIFGWHGGLTLETPPASVSGLLKQRMRWFWGSILNLRYVPRSRLPRRVYSITSWFDGLLITIAALVLLIQVYPWQRFSNIYLIWGLTLTGVFWLLRYQIGVYQNLRFSPLSRGKKLLLQLGIIPLAPVADLLCNLPTVIALIKRPRAFEITAKKAN